MTIHSLEKLLFSNRNVGNSLLPSTKIKVMPLVIEPRSQGPLLILCIS